MSGINKHMTNEPEGGIRVRVEGEGEGEGGKRRVEELTCHFVILALFVRVWEGGT